MRTTLRSFASTLVAMTMLAPLALAATATAAPAAEIHPALGDTEIPWNQMGLDDRLQLVGADESTDVSVPIPLGVTQRAVTGQIGAVANVQSGRVEVYDGAGTALGSIPLPAESTTVPFSVDTSQASAEAGVTRLSFILRDNDSSTNTCSPMPSLTLWQLSSAFSGQVPHPSSIGDFFPGYLDGIVIRVGPEPAPDQQQAALSLVATLTHLYRPIPVRIDVDTSPISSPITSRATSRVIEIRPGDEPGAAVEDPGSPAAKLVITGTGTELQRQVDLFTDRRFALTQTVSTSVTAATSTLPVSTDTLTFDELGATRQVAVLQTATLYSGFDGAAFGIGPIQQAKVHVRARHTPVVDGSGSVVIRSGDTVLMTQRLDESGVLDAVLDVPAETITSNISLAFDLRYFPHRECAPLSDRMFFALDGASSVTVTQGANNRGGFPVLPMAFTPGFDVSVDHPEQIRHAARVINLLGRETAAELRPNVRRLDEAVAANNGLLAVTTAGALGRLGMNPPLKTGDSDGLTVDSRFLTTEVDPNGPVGFIQAFTQNGRMVIDLQTTGDDILIDRTLDFVSGLERQWASLTGDVVATATTGKTVSLSLQGGDWMERQVTPSTAWTWWFALTLAIGVAAAVAVAAVLTLRRRRHPTTE